MWPPSREEKELRVIVASKITIDKFEAQKKKNKRRGVTISIYFEERAKYLADVLINRGYKVKLLQKQFCKVTEKYRAEFQKWLVPSNSVTWFNQIVSSS